MVCWSTPLTQAFSAASEPLRDLAHEVRLTANVGAPEKPSSEAEALADNLEGVTKEDAADIVECTNQYLQHVYVMPAKLEARRARTKPK
jgi:hypothetical protein